MRHREVKFIEYLDSSRMSMITNIDYNHTSNKTKIKFLREIIDFCESEIEALFDTHLTDRI
jgi:hypothetical protein